MNRQSVRQRGAAMVEFALILPLLIVLVFGITELGRAIYQTNTLDKAISSGVRFMTRYNGLLDPEDCGKLDTNKWDDVADIAANLVANGKEVGGTPLLPGLKASDVTIELDEDNNVDDDTGCVIKGSVEVSFVSLFGDSVVPLLNLGPIMLTASSEERYHGE